MSKRIADEQISAESILMDAYKSADKPINKTKVKIADLEELHEYQRRQRQGYEDALRRNRLDFGQWARYALFEADQKEIARARSIFERALEVNPHHVPLWVKYIDMELKNRNVNHARNLLDRATLILPRVNKLWFKYVQVEEVLQNVAGARSVFERWIKWEPTPNVWDQYVNFEKRYDATENVRTIFNHYVMVHAAEDTWLKWVKFEKEFGTPDTVREVFSTGIDSLPTAEHLIVEFAQFEALQKEYERARAIFKFGLTKIPSSKLINDELIKFEKQFGQKEGIELSILAKRKIKYESELEADPRDWDTWWNYFSILDQEGSTTETTRVAFERAIDNAPESTLKQDWKRYIFIWIRYLIFLELHNDISAVRAQFSKLLNSVIPSSFTFSKIWILFSNFEIRQGDLNKARKMLGQSIGKFPKRKTFDHYIKLEIKLKEFDRVRKIFDKYVQSFPTDVSIWLQYANLETELNDVDRARAIYKIAIDTVADKDQVWSAYVEFEKEQRDYDRVRTLFDERLVEDKDRTSTWIELAMFELAVPSAEQLEKFDALEDDQEFEFDVTSDAIVKARAVFERALKYFKSVKNTEARLVMFESFKKFESVHGDEKTRAALDKRLPVVVKKVRELEGGVKEEYFDYVFADDTNMSKFLSNAKKWAKANK